MSDRRAKSVRYCLTCGHVNDRHLLKLYGKQGTACEATTAKEALRWARGTVSERG